MNRFTGWAVIWMLTAAVFSFFDSQQALMYTCLIIANVWIIAHNLVEYLEDKIIKVTNVSNQVNPEQDKLRKVLQQIADSDINGDACRDWAQDGLRKDM